MVLGLLALVLVGRSGSEGAAVSRVAASTARMAERLQELNRAYRERDAGPRPYFSANAPWRIPAYRARLAAATDPREILNVRYELVQQLLWDGQSVAALREIETLEALAGSLTSAQAASMRTLLRPWHIIANLRIGEQRNCLAHPGAAACLFPIQRGGVHADRAGSEAARKLLLELLENSPNDLAALWLLNLASMTLGEYPAGVPERWRIDPSVFASEADVGQFRNVAPEVGVANSGLAGGAVLEDLDGDGRLDVVASSWGLDDQLRYLHNDGDGFFSDRTEAGGLTGEVGGLNLNHADYDNDGHPDLLVMRGGWLGPNGAFPPSLLRNRGDGTFEDVTEHAGLLVAAQPGQTAAWDDYDGDGWLDLFLGHETSSPDDSHASQLFHNERNGRLREIGAAVGLADLGWVKGAVWGDYDNDGRPDLYVSRLGQDNLLFHNEGRGAVGGPPWVFRDVGRKAGVTGPRMSFPTWFFDYDNDGWLDLFVGGWDAVPMGQVAALALGRPTSAERPRLYHNEGNGRFQDVTAQAGLDRVLLAMGANFGDVDEDGWEDIYVGTGAPSLWVLMPNRMFRNDGGRHFQDVTTSGGFGHLQKGHGIAFGDVDGDGDQDVYAVMGGWYSGDVARNVLFENPGHGRHWIVLRLEGVRSNRSAIGARIDVVIRTVDGERHIRRVVGTGGSFGSSSLQQEVGLAEAQAISRLEIRWPTSGVIQNFAEVPLDQVYRVREDSRTLEQVSVTPFRLGSEPR